MATKQNGNNLICCHLVALHLFFQCVSEWCFCKCLFDSALCSFSSCLSLTKHWLHTCLPLLLWFFSIHKLKCSFVRIFLQLCRMHCHWPHFLRGAAGAVQHSSHFSSAPCLHHRGPKNNCVRCFLHFVHWRVSTPCEHLLHFFVVSFNLSLQTEHSRTSLLLFSHSRHRPRWPLSFAACFHSGTVNSCSAFILPHIPLHGRFSLQLSHHRSEGSLQRHTLGSNMFSGCQSPHHWHCFFSPLHE